MRPQIHWIDLPMAGRLAIMARPRAGDWLEDEISGWRAQGIDVVISLLEREEVRDLELQREADLCHEQGMEFLSFPIPDRGVPVSLRDTVILARTVSARIGGGRAVAVHCRAGIGRSALIAACALVCSGADPAVAFEAIGRARGVRVPDTETQIDWVSAFRDSAIAACNE
ncbi:MAG: protein-tyrosine phosphatase family protein [Pseudomonadota bacterium]